MKIPKWFWFGYIGLCLIQWTVGIWIEEVTNNARDAFLIIVIISFILYPVFSILSIWSFKKNNTKRIGSILLLLGFITNPAVYPLVKSIL
jgi:hypothetical protein